MKPVKPNLNRPLWNPKFDQYLSKYSPELQARIKEKLKFHGKVSLNGIKRAEKEVLQEVADGKSTSIMTVANLTLEELKTLIRESVKQTLTELLSDPDEGLELNSELQVALQHSLAEIEAGGKTQPAQDVAAKLGLDW
ncbi:MAG: hypothetical protein NTW14_00410 [bacterium]|nr:hypothetical protein [bacterium]